MDDNLCIGLQPCLLINLTPLRPNYLSSSDYANLLTSVSHMSVLWLLRQLLTIKLILLLFGCSETSAHASDV